MSDTPDKPTNPFLEGQEESSDKKSPWFVTPMGDKKEAQKDDTTEDKQDQGAKKIRLQPGEHQQSEAAEKPAAQPQQAAPKPVAPRPAAAKPAAPRPATSKPSPTASKPRAKPSAVAGLTFDDDQSSKVSTPMLALDALAAVIAVTFAALILHDLWPFF